MTFEEYDLPWPIKNEWVVRRYTFDENGDKMRASWHKMTEDGSANDGFWELEPYAGNKTLLTYHYKVKAKENCPRAIFKAGVSLTVNSMIKSLRLRSAKMN